MKVRKLETGTEYFSKRRRRFDGDQTPRELTFSCYGRLPFLSRDRTRRWFVKSLQHVLNHSPVDLWGWVVMPEHVHLLVAPREAGVEIGRFQGKAKERVARLAIRWMEDNAPQWLPRITVKEGGRLRRRFWQPGGGYDRNIDNLRTLQSVIDYIHHNPVRRGLVDRAIDWAWSSARWYAGESTVPLEIHRTLPTFES